MWLLPKIPGAGGSPQQALLQDGVISALVTIQGQAEEGTSLPQFQPHRALRAYNALPREGDVVRPGGYQAGRL